MKEEAVNKESSIVVPALVSGLVGAGLALLLAPKSGKEIRQDLGRFARKAGNQAAETVEEGQLIAKEAVQTGQEALAEQTELLAGRESATSEGRSFLVPVLISGVVGAAIGLLLAPKPGKDVIEDLKDMASSAVDKGKGWYEQGAAAVKEAIEKGKESAAEAKEKLRPAA